MSVIHLRPLILAPLAFVVFLSLVFMFMAEQTTLWFAVGMSQQKLKLKHIIYDGLTSNRKILDHHQANADLSLAFRFDADVGSSRHWFRMHGAVPNVYCKPSSKHRQSRGGNSDKNAGETVGDRMVRQSLADNLIKEISGEAETSILYSFSPRINQHVATMFSRQVKREPWFTIYPFQVSCLPKRHRLFCLVRVWFRLDRFESYVNRFQDSYFYLMELDEQLNYIPKTGRILGIPAAIQNKHYTGPEDPRLIMINGSIYASFIMGHDNERRDETFRRQFLFSLDDSKLYDVDIFHYKQNGFEKNWSPWVVNNSLLYLYQLIPRTRILFCPLMDDGLANCSFAAGGPPNEGPIETSQFLLRGGSPFVHYTGDYYLAITHSVQQAYTGKAYASQLTMINGPAARVVFVSSPILLEPKVMKTIESTDRNIIRPFFYARSLFVEDENNVVLAGGVNDNSCFLVRLRGIASILQEAIELDRKRVVEERTTPSSECSFLYERLQFSYSAMENWIRARNLLVLDTFFYRGA